MVIGDKDVKPCRQGLRGGTRKLFWEGHIGRESPKASRGKTGEGFTPSPAD